MSTIRLRPMTIDDYGAVYQLWRVTDGVGLAEADDREPITRYLERFPGLSTVAVDGEEVVAAVLCGHNGRRGYLFHLAVAETHQRRGIGSRIVDGCLGRLAELGIDRCNLYVYPDNADGIAFWERRSFAVREDLVVMQGPTAPEAGVIAPPAG